MIQHNSAVQVKRFASALLLAVCLALPAAAQYTSSYPQMSVAGDFNNFETLTPNMTLIGDNLWQADLTITNEVFWFKFAGVNYNPNWGLADSPNNLPLAHTAVASGPDIFITNRPIAVIDGSVTNFITNSLLRFTFNDATREFSVFLLNNLDSENLLYNGSFETIAVSGPLSSRARYWYPASPNNHGDMLGNARRFTATNAFDGAWLMDTRGLGSGARNTSSTFWQETPAQAGVTYEASARFQFADPLNSWTGATRQLRLDYFDFNRTNTLASFVTDLSDLSTNVIWAPRNITGLAPDHTAWARLTVIASDYGSNGYLRVDDARLKAFVAKRTEDFNTWGLLSADDTYSRSGWIIGNGRTVSDPGLVRSGFAASLANPAVTGFYGYVRSPRFDDGIGTIRFWYRQGPAYDPLVDTNEAVTMAVQVSTIGDFWTTIGQTSFVFNTTYQEYIASAPPGAYRYFRIVHAGNSANRLLLEDISVTASEGQPRLMDFNYWTNATTQGLHLYGGWAVSNGLVSASLALSGQSGQIAGSSNSAYALYAPVFTNGYGAVSFSYRAGLDSSRSLGFALESRSATGTVWTERARITNINTTAWQTYEQFFLDPTPQQLRIRNLYETTTAPGITPNLSEGFGLDAPSGWTFNSSYQIYGGTTESGTNSGPPALKFDGSSTNALTPGLVTPTNVSFMIRGANITGTNSFLVERFEGGSWQTITNFTLTSANNSRAYYNFKLSTNVSQLRFTYEKTGGGNLSFDDFFVKGLGFANPNAPQRLILDNVNIDAPTEVRFQDFNTWPAKADPNSGTALHQGWTLTGPSRIVPSQAISGNALLLGRASSSSGGGSSSEYVADFENSSKSSYASGTITNNGLQWNLTDALIGTDVSDWKNGAKSVRMRGYTASSMTMLQNWTNGLGLISFNYRRYGSDSQIPYQVEYSANSGSTWTNAGSTFTGDSEVRTFTHVVNQTGKNFRVRIKATATSSSNKRLNIDDVTLTAYSGAVAGPATNGVLTTHYFTDGIGGISFGYRHGSETTPQPSAILTAAIQTSANGTQWTTRDSLVISNSTYATYNKYFSLATNHYVRIAITNGIGEAALDNVEIRAPQPPATIALSGFNEPEIPFADNEITLKAQATPLYGASAITITSYYRTVYNNITSSYKTLRMIDTGGNQFTAISNIPPQPSGTRIDYYLRANFSGPGSELTSPLTFPAGAPTNLASFGVPRNPPGKVWINEVDYYAQIYSTNCPGWDGWTVFCPDILHQFVELAGFEGLDLQGWSIEVYNGDVLPADLLGTYTITNFLIPNESNGFGFFLLAGDGINAPPRDMLFTNNLWANNIIGIRLLNEFGGVEDAWSAGGFIPDFSQIPAVDDIFVFDEESLTNSLSLIGTSAGRENFDWDTETTYPTPGMTNIGQVFAEPASIGVSTNSLIFPYFEGSLNSPAVQILVISNAGVANLDYDLTTSPSWISIAPSSGSLAAGQSLIHTVRVDSVGLTGNRTGYVKIDGEADNNPFFVSILAQPADLGAPLIHYAFKTERIDTFTKTVLNDGSLGSSADLDLIDGAEFSLAGRGITGTRNDIALESLSNTARGVSSSLTALNGLSQFTLSGWLKPNSGAVTGRHLLFSNRSGTNGISLFASNDYRNLTLQVNGLTVSSTNSGLASNVWNFFAVTFDGTNTGANAVKFYVGETNTLSVVLGSTASRLAVTSSGTSTGLVSVGGDHTNAFDGLIDDLRLYAQALAIENLEEVRRDGSTSFTGFGTPPGFLAQPSGGTYTVSQIGINHNFTISVSGDPTPSITWRKDGVEIEGANLASYSVVVDFPTLGLYDAVLDNGFGRVTSQVAEVMFQLEFLAQSPTNIYIYAGDTARIAMQLTPGNNGYRWVSNSVTMAGFNTNVLTLVNFRNTNSPSFYMVATNKTGSVTSQVVRVHVIDMAFEPDNGAQGISKSATSAYMVLSWPSISNRYYDILWSTNLMSGTASFITIASNLPSATPFNIYTDTVHSAQPAGYYRIKSKESP